jgi:hypothetical protein
MEIPSGGVVANCLGVHGREIQDNMELAHSNEHNYQLELHAYQTTFPHFKYEPPSFVYVEIGISSKVPTTPSMVQPVTITNQLVH